MNCKQGDLAFYTGRDTSCIGLIVRCVQRCPVGEWLRSEPFWVVDPPLPRDDGLGKAISVADRSLRPIRDPGDDAVDESLLWLPSPTKELA